VASEFRAQRLPLVESEQALSYWARESDRSLFIFFSHPDSRNLKFPLEYGQSFRDEIRNVPVVINYKDRSYQAALEFLPNQSLLYEIKDGKFRQVDISLEVKTPQIRERPDDFESPWLVR
jgi:hypothetical protein